MTDDAHWRGEISAQVAEHERRLNDVNGHIADIGDRIGEVAVKLGSLYMALRVMVVIGLLIAAPLIGLLIELSND